MKSTTRIIFSFFVASGLVASCHLFTSDKKQNKQHPLVGEWQVDSIRAGNDSNLAYMLIAMAMNDSAGIKIRFTKDSVFTISGSNTDTSLYQYNEEKNTFVSADAADHPYIIQHLSDSTLVLEGKDSNALFLRKK